MSKRAETYQGEEQMRGWLEGLPERFAGEGRVIYKGRNELREMQAGARRLVVKRFKRDSLIQKLVRRFVKGKAEKSFRNACRLIECGINTPHPVGWLEVRNGAGFRTDQYYVCEYTDARPIAGQVIDERKYDPEFMKALAGLFVTLHEKGIYFRDSNNTNIRYVRTPDGIEFELIDINRMRFKDMSEDECFENMTKFCYPTPGFRYMLGEYVKLRGWPADRAERGLQVKLKSDRAWDRRKSIAHPCRPHKPQGAFLGDPSEL